MAIGEGYYYSAAGRDNKIHDLERRVQLAEQLTERQRQELKLKDVELNARMERVSDLRAQLATANTKLTQLHVDRFPEVGDDVEFRTNDQDNVWKTGILTSFTDEHGAWIRTATGEKVVLGTRLRKATPAPGRKDVLAAVDEALMLLNRLKDKLATRD